MKESKILEKAMEKASKNNPDLDMDDLLFEIEDFHSPIPVIFSHEFAKAFWGEELHDKTKYGEAGFQIQTKEWQYQLQKMVLEENPVKYLEQFL